MSAILPLLLAVSVVSGFSRTHASPPEGGHDRDQARPPGSLTSLVNPFIGTGGHGHTYPGPSLPFGMIQPGPDTRIEGWDSCSGYHYSDTRIFGFSQTHLSGTGIPDYNDVLLVPITGEVRLSNGADGRPGYPSRFSHDDEIAAPGYYAVTLQDYGVRAELTTTLRAGLHRYTFPKGQPAHVLVDLTHRDEVLDSSLQIVSGTEVAGLRRSRSWASDQWVFFVLRFSRPVVSSAMVIDGEVRRLQRDARGTSLKAVFDFGDAGGPLQVKVAISAVSVEGARKNLDAELPGWDFDAVRLAANDAWERELGRIRVEGGTRDQRVIFYTALYHAFLTPNVYMDVDGQYRGRDLHVHRADGFTYYSVFSLWDTFRALHPLLAIVDRARTRDFVRTFLRQYQDGGRLPVWELAGNETDTMIGYHAVPVIADAILSGIGGFDANLALEAMKHSAEEDRFGLAAFKRDGYISGHEDGESVSKTLEYAFDDWCIAQVARALGRPDDYARYIRRAQAYKHLFDPSTGFMRARVEGFWYEPRGGVQGAPPITRFDPAEVNIHYTEANAWQYSFYVPHDVEGLMRLHGGPDAFAQKLDALFSADSRTSGREQADITGLVGQYAHGNEPSHHMAYLYAYAGQAWKTQAMARRLMDTMYSAKPDGLIGNEDCGQMSAWFVMSALGFYPVAAGGDHYVLGTPLFPGATIRLEDGRAFVIRANRVSAGAPYIQHARLNGAEHGRAFLDRRAVLSGGTLVLEMGAEPSTSWGSDPDGRPRSAVADHPIVAAPFIAAGARVFRGTTAVELGHIDQHAAIHYTLDGREPTVASPRYAGPIEIADSATLKAVAVAGGESSAVLTASVRRLPDRLRLTLSAPYAPQYSAGGDEALVDGLRGGGDFRLGRWQGYRGVDLDATIDFGEPREIGRVSVGFLQDVRAWILMPRQVAFEVSDDGVAFRPVGTAGTGVPEREPGSVTRDVQLDLSTPDAGPVRARYLRVRVQRYGKLPAWHVGAGEEAWYFVDEIVVFP